MEIYIYNKEVELLGVIDEITTFIWTRKYFSPGDFKLLVPFKQEYLDLLKLQNLIIKGKDKEAAEIRYIKITKDTSGKEQIEVEGKLLSIWLSKRVVERQITVVDTVSNIMKRIVSENFVLPVDEMRKLQGLYIDNTIAVVSSITNYSSEPYISAQDALFALAVPSRLGFRVITDVKTKQHLFQVYEGLDHSISQNINHHCIFSQEYNNILDQEFTLSIENKKSTAYIAGEDVAPRLFASYGTDAVGHDRDELYLDASDITRAYTDEKGTQQTHSEAEYISFLVARGRSSVESRTETISFECGLNMYANMRYRVDFDLGDKVTCIDKRWGVRRDVRITEISETYQNNQVSLSVNFGDSAPSLLTQIKQSLGR